MSLYNKIRIIFLVAVLFTTAFFTAFFSIQKTDHIQQIQKRYIQTALYLSKHLGTSDKSIKQFDYSDPALKLFLKESDFLIIRQPEKIKDILTNGHTVYQRKLGTNEIKIIGDKGTMHLAIETPCCPILLQDRQPVFFPWRTLFWYLSALLFLMLLYLWLTRSLTPLKRLQTQIQSVIQGDLSVSLREEGQDEIAQVANAFDDALRKLESLIHSRQLFLRSIMHELKTPIAKGKLLNAFLSTPREKEHYDAVFERLELLIEEFAKIERMLSSSYEAKLTYCSAIDIVEQALELMILDEEELQEKITLRQEEGCRLYTDFDLLSLAVKNLIDNAIKYAPDHHVTIHIDDTGITLSNNGERFTKTLDPYLKPFHDQKHGLGLGLYIVQNIIQMLSLNLTYDYTQGQNRFRISQCTK